MPEIRHQAPDHRDLRPTAPASAPGRRRRPARALKLAAVGAGAVAVLAACEKPAPGVTLWSGTTSVRAEASCWGNDPSAPTSGVPTCSASTVEEALAATDVPSVAVLADGTVGISVDPAVAEDGGWYPAIATSKLVGTPITSTYYRFTFPAGQNFPAKGYPLEIVAVGEGSTPRGVWIFRLTDATTG